jgi:hypothetical protein
MDKYNTYLDIISNNCVVDIYRMDICEHKKVKLILVGFLILC